MMGQHDRSEALLTMALHCQNAGTAWRVAGTTARGRDTRTATQNRQATGAKMVRIENSRQRQVKRKGRNPAPKEYPSLS
jgi:hypothetical protein